MFSNPGAYDGWNYTGHLSIDLTDEGSGGGVKPGGVHAAYLNSSPDRFPVLQGAGLCQGGALSHHLRRSGAAGDGGIPGFCAKYEDFHGGGG